MLDEKVKLEEYFREEIQRVSELQIEGIDREIEQIHKKSIKSLEETAQQEAGLQRESELREMQSEHAISLSRLHEDTSRKLMEKRKQLSEAIFDEVKAKVLTFVKSDAYEQKLLDKITKLQKQSLPHAILHVAKRDEAMLEKLCAAYGHGCEGCVDATIEIGGFLMECSEDGIVIDETFDAALDEQRSWFYTNSGLFIK